MATIVFINGAPNSSSRLNGLLQFAVSFLEKEKISHGIIDVHKLPSEDLLSANYASPVIKEANARLQEAAGVIVLTPVYKASYSDILKTYLDLIPQKGLENKIILPLVIGGSAAHLLAIEYALKPVLSVLGANQFISGVYVVDQQIERIGNHQFTISDEAEARLMTRMKELMVNLNNWKGAGINVS